MKLPSERTFSNLINVGFFMVGIGVFMSIFLFLHIALFVILGSLGIVLIFAGLCVIGFTVVTGLNKTKTLRDKAAPVTLDGVKIQGKYFFNSIGEMLFDPSLCDYSEDKLYLRLEFPNGASSEFECNRQVWDSVGEGQRGTALVQGDWVGQFTPEARPVPAAGQNPYT